MMWMAAFVMGQRIAGKAAGLPPVTGIAAGGLDRQLAELEQRMERMMLLTEAMWEVLASDGHTEDELIAKVEEVRQRNRQATERVISCRSCGARVLPGEARCQICGEGSPQILAGPPGSDDPDRGQLGPIG